MRNELILLVAYKPDAESAPTSKILRIRRGTISQEQLDHYHAYLNIIKLLRHLLDNDRAIILHITVLNQIEDFLLRL